MSERAKMFWMVYDATAEEPIEKFVSRSLAEDVARKLCTTPQRLGNAIVVLEPVEVFVGSTFASRDYLDWPKGEAEAVPPPPPPELGILADIDPPVDL